MYTYKLKYINTCVYMFWSTSTWKFPNTKTCFNMLAPVICLGKSPCREPRRSANSLHQDKRICRDSVFEHPVPIDWKKGSKLFSFWKVSCLICLANGQPKAPPRFFSRTFSKTHPICCISPWKILGAELWRFNYERRLEELGWWSNWTCCNNFMCFRNSFSRYICEVTLQWGIPSSWCIAYPTWNLFHNAL